MKTRLKFIGPYLRIGFSILLLWLAFRGVDWKTLRSADIEVSPKWLIFAMLIMLLGTVLASLRWAWIARSAGINLPIARFIKIYFAGLLINQGLPTMIGGDSYRAIEAHRLSVTINPVVEPTKLRIGFFVVLLDRGLGFVGNNIVGASGLIFAGSLITGWATTLGVAVLAAMLGGMALCALLLAWPTSHSLVNIVLKKLHLSAGLPALTIALGSPTFIIQLMLSVAVHLCGICGFGFCLRAYGAAVPIEALMVALPALGLLTLLPISISGWGLRESTFATVLVLWNVDPTITLISSVSFGLVNLLTSLPGAWALLQRARHHHPTQQSELSKS